MSLRSYTESWSCQRCTFVRLMPYCAANSYALAEDCWICARTAGVVVAFL